ncbi:MAG: cob(I)yrinic acid a,c-diamide adenosyltransferase [Ectothiorhodospiraceae bacterium]|nr:cob(I)yrinic acid a,c-diamide adenosyltransferase [Ectothiorhodospiraceae bacterium]
MVKLTRIYTRTGDSGTTGLGDGSRVDKHGLRVAAYGTVDEANAALGVARLHVPSELDAAIERVQNDLFDVGADLCMPERDDPPYPPLRVTEAQVRWLEQDIDRMNAGLPSLRSFVLPGGTAAAAYLHLARTVARRAERDVAALAGEEQINPLVLSYMNRLSDWVFVAARHVNHAAGRGDVLWQPGQNRA